eukprot:gnl/Spiro4/28505_TR14090_c0_g1_i1.p1 gnl/Spiro4/28505_TR14090_c0_g1~~gnl/Spiro4/28505_TR14090_c0_g1_i1.p1  ORF type:complete len:568 (+),score=69.69 gnl/Spiro4/28505_TR14090_c0_g1_i1:120-1823(+)
MNPIRTSQRHLAPHPPVHPHPSAAPARPRPTVTNSTISNSNHSGSATGTSVPPPRSQSPRKYNRDGSLCAGDGSTGDRHQHQYHHLHQQQQRTTHQPEAPQPPFGFRSEGESGTHEGGGGGGGAGAGGCDGAPPEVVVTSSLTDERDWDSYLQWARTQRPPSRDLPPLPCFANGGGPSPHAHSSLTHSNGVGRRRSSVVNVPPLPTFSSPYSPASRSPAANSSGSAASARRRSSVSAPIAVLSSSRSDGALLAPAHPLYFTISGSPTCSSSQRSSRRLSCDSTALTQRSNRLSVEGAPSGLTPRLSPCGGPEASPSPSRRSSVSRPTSLRRPSIAPIPESSALIDQPQFPRQRSLEPPDSSPQFERHRDVVLEAPRASRAGSRDDFFLMQRIEPAQPRLTRAQSRDDLYLLHLQHQHQHHPSSASASSNMSNGFPLSSSYGSQRGGGLLGPLASPVWGLDSILKNSVHRERFRKFLASISCSELFEFYYEVSDFFTLRGFELKKRAKETIKKFIRSGAPNQINISDAMRKEIETLKESKFHPLMFQAALDHVREIMESELVPRFLES